MPGWLDEAARVLGGGAGLGAGLGGVFFALKWVFEYVGGRMDRRAAALDDGTQRLMDRLEARIDELTKRVTTVERELADCQTKHAESEAKAARLEAMLLATRPGLKRAFPPEDCIPKDMAVLAAKMDGGEA